MLLRISLALFCFFVLINLHAQTCSCEDVTVAIPDSLHQLTGGTKTFVREFKLDEAQDLNLVYINGESKRNSKVIVHDFLQYKEFNCEEGKARKKRKLVWGVGVRLTVTVLNATKEAKLTNLASISAAVEYNLAEVIYELHAIGVTGEKVRLSMAESGKFSVENYAGWVRVKDQIIRLIGDPEVSVVPQLIIDEYIKKKRKKRK